MQGPCKNAPPLQLDNNAGNSPARDSGAGALPHFAHIVGTEAFPLGASIFVRPPCQVRAGPGLPGMERA